MNSPQHSGSFDNKHDLSTIIFKKKIEKKFET